MVRVTRTWSTDLNLSRERFAVKICDTCGNEISDHATICPHCESHVSMDFPHWPRVKIRTINLEAGFPTTEEALRRLENEMAGALQDGIRLVRLIHGYGSSGKGGNYAMLFVRTCRARNRPAGCRRSFTARNTTARIPLSENGCGSGPN